VLAGSEDLVDPMYLAMDFNVLHACHDCRFSHLLSCTLERTSWCFITVYAGSSVLVGRKAACMRLNVATAGLGSYMSFNERTLSDEQMLVGVSRVSEPGKPHGQPGRCLDYTVSARGLLYGRRSDETRCLGVEMIRDYSKLHFLVLQNRTIAIKHANNAGMKLSVAAGVCIYDTAGSTMRSLE
jgi:hypothetical protein